MKIEFEKEKKTVDCEELKDGDCFVLENSLFIMTNHEEESDSYLTINLSTGYMEWIHRNKKVLPQPNAVIKGIEL